MSSSQYNYDEDGETWPYFVLTLVAVALVPYTIATVRSLFRKEAKTAQQGVATLSHTFAPPHAETIRAHATATRAKEFFSLRVLVLAVGWGLVAYLVMILKENTHVNAFDPYAILEVSLLATEKEIKSRYRKLSLTFHPDKVASDLSVEAKKAVEEAFIRINQAYKALTDEETKKNYKLYGHPDGPQERLMGIALPKFLIEGAYSPLLVVAYFAIIVGVLPYVVGKWWNNVRTHTKMGIHVETATLFVTRFINMLPAKLVTPYTLIQWLSHATEFSLRFPSLSPAEVEQHILAHLGRTGSDRTTVEIVAMLPKLINALLDVSSSFRNSEVTLHVIDLKRCVAQAVLPGGKYAQLLQLPFVDPKVVVAQPVKTLGKLFTLSDEKIGAALGIKDKAELREAIEVAAALPVLKLVDAKFVVPGESVVTPESNVYLELRVLVKSAKHTLKNGKLPELDLAKMEAMDQAALQFDNLKDPMAIAEAQPLLPSAYAPWFPGSVASGWVICPMLQSDGKLAEAPVHVNHLDLANVTLEKLEGDLSVGILKMKYQAPTPASAGDYQFRIVVRNVAYFGADLDFPLVMTVKDPPADPTSAKVYELGEDDDEEEEVSSDDDSDESDLEGGEESDWSDTNTDTEDESEK